MSMPPYFFPDGAKCGLPFFPLFAMACFMPVWPLKTSVLLVLRGLKATGIKGGTAILALFELQQHSDAGLRGGA